VRPRKHENTKNGLSRSRFVLSCFRGWLATVLCSASCATPLMKLPSGSGAPAPDGREALADATSACRAVSTITAEIAVSGSVGGQRLRARISAGLAPPASARLEAVAPFGAPIFIFAAVNDEATLLLPRDDRVLEHGRSDAVLEAVAGVPLDAAGLRHALTGCASLGVDAARATQAGADWRIVPDGSSDVYLRREGTAGRWRLVSTAHHDASGGWRAEYAAFQPNGLPQTVRFTSSPRDRFDLRMTLSQVEINATLGADVFRVQVPRTAEPITLSELKHARPGVRED
jgi:hypothetical protein